MPDEPRHAMRTPVRVPLMAALAERLQLTAWFVSVGESVEAGDVVCEIGVPGIVVSVHAPASGRLLQRGVAIGEAIEPHAVLGWIATTTDVPIEPEASDGERG